MAQLRIRRQHMEVDTTLDKPANQRLAQYLQEKQQLQLSIGPDNNNASALLSLIIEHFTARNEVSLGKSLEG